MTPGPRRVALLAGLLGGCVGPSGTGEPELRGTVSVAFSVEEPPSWLLSLSLRVEQVVLEGYGPDGPASVATEVAAVVPLLTDDEAPPIGVSLPFGEWDPVRLTVHLASREDAPALALEGVREDRPFVLSVLELSLSGEGALLVDDGGTRVGVALFPAEWDELLEATDEDDEGEDDGAVRIDVAHDRETYDRVLDEIDATTRFRFAGGDD
jgi:hypothetical protein